MTARRRPRSAFDAPLATVTTTRAWTDTLVAGGREHHVTRSRRGPDARALASPISDSTFVPTNMAS